MPKLKDPTATQAVHLALNEIRVARVKGGEADGRRKQAMAEANAAHEEHLAELENVARGQKSAEERAKAAHERRMAALERADLEKQISEAAQRVARSEQARIQQIRERHWAEFVEEAEAAVTALREAAERLVEPLRDYLATWEQTRAKWSAISPATLHHLLERDQEAGRLRDINSVYEDASLPPCPIDANSPVAVMNVLPRPRFMTAEEEPLGEPVEITDAPVDQ